MPVRTDTLYSGALLMLTIATGAADGVSFVALNQVFAGNMTGNVLFIGFGVAGAMEIDPRGNAAALTGFLLGALACSAILRGVDPATRIHRRSLLVLGANGVVVAVLVTGWRSFGDPGEFAALGLTTVLAFVLGMQAAAVRPAGIRDLSTVVVTMTMVNLAVDTIADGRPQRLIPRVAAVAFMAVGGFLGAVLVLLAGGPSALASVFGLMVAGCVLLALAHRSEARAPRSGSRSPGRGG